MLPVTDGATALDLGERVRAAAQAMTTDTAGCSCTVSVGVSAVSKADTQFDQLLTRADMALNQAKNAGRNRVVMVNDHCVPA